MKEKIPPLKTLALAIYRLRVLIILHKSSQHLFNYTEELSMSNYTKTPELYKIAFLFQVTSNSSELTVELSGVCFEHGREALVPSIPSRFQSPVAHLTVSRARFCGPVFF